MKIALVDLSAVYWTAWHANPDGEVSAAYQGTMRRCRELLSEYDTVAVCVDSPQSWRRETYPDYKATREPKPAGAVELLRRTEDELRGLCHVLGADGYEADDVIATAALWATPGHAVDIISSDKDLWQCLSGYVRQCRLNGDVVTADGLLKNKGLRPEQVPDYLALIGDTSDNLPGVAGVGPKTAVRMLHKFDNLEGIIAAADAGHELFRTKAGKPTAASSAIVASLSRYPDLAQVRHLATCRTDAPIECSVLNVPTIQKAAAMTDEILEAEPEPSQPETPPAPSSAPEPAPSSRASWPFASTPTNGS